MRSFSVLVIQEDTSALRPVSGIFTMVSFSGQLIVGLLVMGTKVGNNICHHLDDLTLQLFKYYQNLLRFFSKIMERELSVPTS